MKYSAKRIARYKEKLERSLTPDAKRSYGRNLITMSGAMCIMVTPTELRSLKSSGFERIYPLVEGAFPCPVSMVQETRRGWLVEPSFGKTAEFHKPNCLEPYAGGPSEEES